jgi:hypothetical protein
MSKQVSSYVVELLHSEMVYFFTKDSKYSNYTEKCYSVIEELGFQVGQKLSERL